MKRARRARAVARGGFKAVRPNVAGVDLGSREHWVCGPRVDGKRNVRQFRATTPQLHEMLGWLQAQGVESVAMESTSVYWIPLYELLEAHGIEVVLVNVRHLSRVPGRKSDVQDCEWLQQLHSCALLQGSFRPDEGGCRLRALARERANLGAERTRIVQRMQKALDQMNVQVHHAVSDLTGKTGLAIVRAIVAGERNPDRLAALRDRRCKKSVTEIAEHLTGTWREEHLFNLQMGLRRYDEILQVIAEYDAQLRSWIAQMAPAERREQNVPVHPNAGKEKAMRRRGEQATREALWRWTGVDLTHIDGLGAAASEAVLTETGPDLRAFPDEDHFVSWLRLSPNTPTSAGKPVGRRRNGTGATRIAGVLRMAACTLAHSPSAMGAFYRRMARRKGSSVAIFATARKLATFIYRMLRYGQQYVDEGAAAYEARFHQQRLRQLTQTAKQLGYMLVPALEAG